MAAKFVVLIAVLAVAAAEEVVREKKQAIVGAYPYGYAADDGSYFPGKYEGTGVAPLYRYAGYNNYPYNYGYNYPAAASAYSAYPYNYGYNYPAAASAYSAYPYNYNFAAKYVAAAPAVVAKSVAAPVVAAPVVAAPLVPAYYAAKDDGSYFPGKYGPEYQL